MSDYERAIEALTKAGATDITSPYEDESEDECWSLNKEPVDWLIYPGEASGDARLVVNLSDLPALLNPITPEKVEKAVRGFLSDHQVYTEEDDDGYAAFVQTDDVVSAILARLKEES